MHKNRTKEAGYSLIQFCFVIVILGVLFAGATNIYHIYLTNKVEEKNLNNVLMINNKIKQYRQIKGRYPCPAPLTDLPTDITYGHEDCSSMAAVIAGNSNGAGIWIQESTRTIAAPRVRIGAVPFRSINVDEDEVYDAQRNRLLYVVTESLLDTNTFDDSQGAISIIDGQGQSMITPEASLHYLVLSTGKNGYGAYGLNGNLVTACPAGKLESENCDFAADAIYRSTFRNEADNASEFDDVIRFFSRIDEPLWKRSEIDSDDIMELSTNNVSVGSSVAGVDLDIDGNMRSQPDGPISGDILTNRFCENSGLDCFDHAVIGSTAGMGCTAGEYMTGISGGAAECSPVVSIRCNDDNFPILKGIDPVTRQPICDPEPPASCTNATVTVCSPNDATLLAGAHNTIRTVTGGASRQQSYICNNGSWLVYGSASGLCTCTPSVSTSSPIPCGLGFTGSYINTSTVVCPLGNTVTTNNFASACTCVGGSFPQSSSCPSGYAGSVTWTDTVSCPSGATTSSAPDSSACACTVQPDITQNLGCSTGYIQNPITLPNPARTRVRYFNMATCGHNGWVYTVNNCICDSSATYSDTIPDSSCAPGTVGTITRQFYRNGPSCSWGTPVETPSGCVAIEYKWTTQGTAIFTGAPSAGSTSVPAGTSSCTYADYSSGATQNCHIKLGTTYDIYTCMCQ